METRILAAAACAVLAGPAGAATLDFTTDAGMKDTCARFEQSDAAKLTRDDERTASAICASLALASDVRRWLPQASPSMSDAEGLAGARAQLESYLVRIAAIRATLERVHARGAILTVAPGTWEVDLDGDGTVSLDERYLFWVPKREANVPPFQRANTEADYRAKYVAPVVKVDQADVYWALAYCNFAEAALHLVLSYDVKGAPRAGVVLVDRERVRRQAYARIQEGVRYSIRLRAALLAETDDDHEWIANPRQRDTSFPLVMDAQTFETWGAGLGELKRMLEGRALYGGRIGNGSGVTDLTFGFCARDTGIDVRSLFLDPLVHPLDGAELAARCVAPSQKKPMTALALLASASIQRNTIPGQGPTGEWQVLRHLYWVN